MCIFVYLMPDCFLLLHTHTHTSLFTPFHLTPPQVPLHLIPPSLCHPPVPGQLDEVGVLEISKEATVEDLKITILTLPAVSQSCNSHVEKNFVSILDSSSKPLKLPVLYCSGHFDKGKQCIGHDQRN